MNLVRCLPQFRLADREMTVLAEREAWTRSQIEAFQLKRLNELWLQATEFVPYYQQLKNSLRLPDTFCDLNEFRESVPLLDRLVVKTQQEQLLSRKRARGHWGASGGSTGQPTRFFRDQAAHNESQNYHYRMYQQHGVDFFDRHAYVWGSFNSYAPGLGGLIYRCTQPVKDRLRNRLRLSAYNLNRHALAEYVGRMQRFQPRVVWGFSTAVYLLALEAEARQIKMPSLKVAVLTSEPAFPHMVESVERAFDARVVRQYGSTENGVIAFDTPDGTMRVREDMTLVETVANNQGTYDLVLTRLNNPSFPLIRYAIGDATDRPLETPAQGFAVMGEIIGRTSDVLVTKNGNWIHPQRLAPVFDYVMEIRRYAVHQDAQGKVTCLLELTTSDTPFDTHSLHQQLTQVLEGFPVEMKVVEQIPVTRSGKTRIIVSEIVSMQNPSRETLAAVTERA